MLITFPSHYFIIFEGKTQAVVRGLEGWSHDRTQWEFNEVHHKRLLEKLSFSGTIEISDCLKGEKQELINFPSRRILLLPYLTTSCLWPEAAL